MKNLLYIIMLCISVSVFAAINYDIPYATALPEYDGTISAGEWDDALSVSVSYEDLVVNSSGTSLFGTTPSADDLSGTYYFKWDESYLYMAFVVTDDLLMWRRTSPGPYNGQDTVQIAFNPNKNPTATYLSDAWIFDIVAETSDYYGADIYRHDGAINVDPNMIGSTVGTGEYAIEIALAWSDIKPGLSGKAGDIHGLGLLLVDYDGSEVETLLFDFGNGENVINQPAQWNNMVLVGSDGCGSWGLHSGDINSDCYVNLLDFTDFAAQWMKCNDPQNPDCEF